VRLPVVILVVLAGTAAADDFVPERVTARVAGELGQDTQSLSLDGWYDVNDRFRLGLTTSTDARHELGAGRGLCLNECKTRFGGLAAESQIRVGSNLIGRAAIDTTRFAPTAAAIELGIDARYASGRYAALIAPALRLGIARRDLANGDTAALFIQLSMRAWCNGGVLAIARGGLALDDLRGTPSFGAAGGVYVELGAFTITARFGVADLEAGDSNDHVFGELALGWSS
jgi:hypothetical protein